MKHQKHHLGVEVPSFYEWQRRRQEQEQASASPQARKRSRFEAIFAPPPSPRVEPPQPSTQGPPAGYASKSIGYVDARQWFKVPELWNRIGEMIIQYGHQDLVDTLTPPVYNATRAERELQSAAEIARFFGMSGADFQGLTLEQSWNLIGNFFQALEYSINREKPPGIPGFITFELEPSTGQLLMAYRNQ